MIKDAYGRNWTLKQMQACVGSGWGDIIKRLYVLCKEHNVTVVQVKEKFGTLRFYVGQAPDRVHIAIENAEEESGTICEVCGAKGTLSLNGWAKVRCETCI